MLNPFEVLPYPVKATCAPRAAGLGEMEVMVAVGGGLLGCVGGVGVGVMVGGVGVGVEPFLGVGVGVGVGVSVGVGPGVTCTVVDKRVVELGKASAKLNP
jgi:hypothetical protein